MRYLKIFILLIIGLLFIMPDLEAAPGPGDGNILKRSVEETCHACHKTHLNAPNDPSSIKTHNSQIMESNKWTGGWGIAGGKYGEIVCTTCHTTHNTRNIYLIRESITVPNGTDTWPNGQSSISIDFRVLSGSQGSPGLMGDDSGSHTTSTRVCQACHSRNKYHNYNSQWNSQNGGNLSHNNGSNCTECHKHTKGFVADFAATCGDCHGYPIKSNDVTPGSMGLVVSDEQYSVRGETGRRTQYGSTAKGAHEMHHNKGVSCYSCHYGGKTGAPPDPKFDGIVQIGFSINNNPIGGNYAAPAFPNTRYSIQATGTTNYTATGNRTCSNLYCHSDGGDYAGTISYKTVNWGDTLATPTCDKCHGNQAGKYVITDRHQKHVEAPYNYACKECHSNTVDLNNNIIGSHINNAKDVAWGSIAANSSNYSRPNCSNNYCHSKGPYTSTTSFPSPNVTASWTSTFSDVCVSCHDGDASRANKMNSNAHLAHINDTANQIGRNINCTECHSATISTNTIISNYSLHVNRQLNIKFSGTWYRDADAPTYAGQSATGTAGASKVPGTSNYTCSNVYCHSIGNLDSAGNIVPADGVGFRNAAWNGSAMNCAGCHGDGSTKSHPIYTSGPPGSNTANSHVRHVEGSSISCDYCHITTTTSTSIPPTTVVSGSAHLNRVEDVSMKTVGGITGSYNPTTKVCSNVYCHSDGAGNYINPTWGSTFDGSCTGCHGFAPNTYAHSAHVQNASLLTRTYGSTEVVSNSTNYAFGCGNCHPVNSNKHADGFIDISLNPAEGGTLKSKNSVTWSTSGSGATRTCNGVYCHSNGAEGASLIYRQVTWNESFSINRCGKCHDNPPQYAGQSHYNPNNFMGKEGGHLVGIHFDNIYNGVDGLAMPGTTNTSSHGHAGTSTTISCHICHNGIVSESTVDTYALYNLSTSNMKCSNCHNSGTPTPLQNGVIANKSLHVNGIRNVVIATAYVVKSKAQLRDSSKPSMWTRNVGYKTAGAYDSATLNFTDWNPSTKTCTTACHNNIPVQWGSNAISCASCHNELP